MNERASWPGGHDTSSGRTPAQFLRLADVPPEEEWLANITNPKTRRAYKGDVREFVAYAGLGSYAQLRAVGARACDRLA